MGAPPAIEVSDLTKTFPDGTRALKGVSFSIERGSIVGYLGPNGAGKTTTLKILTNLVRPTRGSASVLGVDVQHDPKEALRQLGALIEVPGVYEYLTPREAFVYFGRIRGLSRSEISARAEEVMATVGLSGSIDTRVGSFSTGMTRRFSIALALLHNPDVLLLDEPVLGLDPRGMADIRSVLRRLGRSGKTLLISSHLLSEVAETCDRVLLLNSGELLLSDSLEHLRASTRSRRLEVELLEPADPRYVHALGRLPGVLGISAQERGITISYDGSELTAARLLRDMVEAGLKVAAFTPTENSLEEIYLSTVLGAGATA